MQGEQGENGAGAGGQVGGAATPAPEHGATAEASHAQSAPTDKQSAPTGAQSAASDARPAVRKNAFDTRRGLLLIALFLLAGLTFIYIRHRRELSSALKAGADKAKEVLTGESAKPRDPYAEAVLQVEADRGEATGRAAGKVEIPAELKQYREPRRFLSIQSAAAAEAGVRPAHDFAELAEMIRDGRDFVEAPRLGRGYVLYGVGLTATGELTHYDTRARKFVPLFANAEELKAYADGLAADRVRINAELKEFDDRLKVLARGDKAERARLLKETAARNKELTRLKESGELIAAYYGKAAGQPSPAPGKADAAGGKAAGVAKAAGREKTTPAKKNAGAAKTADKGKTAGGAKNAGRKQTAGKAGAKEGAGESSKPGTNESAAGKANAASEPRGAARLFAEYALLSDLARDFGGRSYDLHDRESAREFQARLLSFLRPPALAVLEELGTAYQAKFERPLPATSLVRTEEYQRLLRESGNPNAADVAPPPHTTGLAFDIYYRFMTAAEQEFVMGEIARLEREGRVEALRELRDHYHVFVFPEGHPPEAKRVDKILGKPAAEK
jgi:hypothetical protein